MEAWRRLVTDTHFFSCPFYVVTGMKDGCRSLVLPFLTCDPLFNFSLSLSILFSSLRISPLISFSLLSHHLLFPPLPSSPFLFSPLLYFPLQSPSSPTLPSPSPSHNHGKAMHGWAVQLENPHSRHTGVGGVKVVWLMPRGAP